MNKKKTAELIVALALTVALCLGIAGISAYFTDADTATNTFTIGEISLDLQEPSWVGNDNAKNIVPMQTIAKDPQILNDGVNDEFVFMTVAVPYANIVTANDDGTKNAATDTELFTYDVNEGWVEIVSAYKDETAETVIHTYAYGTSDAMTPLDVGTKTPALFDSVTFVNNTENQELEGAAKDITVNAYGIQTTNINGENAVPVDVWKIVSNQDPTTAVESKEGSKTDAKVYLTMSNITVIGEAEDFNNNEAKPTIVHIEDSQNGTFTVSYGMGCVVAIKTTLTVGGEEVESYTRLYCSPVDGKTNTYAFDMSEYGDWDSCAEVIVAIKGDANGDGIVDDVDATQVQSASIGKTQLTELGMLTCDDNLDGKINVVDARG